MKTFNSIYLAFIISLLSLTPSAYAEAGRASPEQANLVIYRPNDYSALNYRIWVDDRYMGKLKPEEVFKLHVSPGKHVIRSNDHNRSELVVTVNEQGVIYVRNEIYRKTRLAITEVQGLQQAVAGI
jgi:hypothetical protein